MLRKTSYILLLSSFGCQSAGRGREAFPSSTVLSQETKEDALDSNASANDKASQPAVYLGEKDPTQNQNLPFGMLELDSSKDSWIISRPQYVMSWNPVTHNLNWAAWIMNESQLGEIGRQPNFSPDPLLTAYIKGRDVRSVSTKDYTGSCWDRGHQVASGDRQGSSEDNRATFYTTNIIPQTAFLNQVIWRRLEDQIKDWIKTEEYKNLWVVAGPIYDKTATTMSDTSGIAIPKSNFKAVFSWDENSKDKPFLVKAVIMPNVLSQGEDPTTHKDILCQESTAGGHRGDEETISQEIDSYKATIQEIEAAAQIRFPSTIEVITP